MGFSAHTDLGASFAFKRLFTLITKHISSPFFVLLKCFASARRQFVVDKKKRWNQKLFLHTGLFRRFGRNAGFLILRFSGSKNLYTFILAFIIDPLWKLRLDLSQKTQK
jgi:hypothetical protein